MSNSGAIKEMFVVRHGGALLNTDSLLHWVQCFLQGKSRQPRWKVLKYFFYFNRNHVKIFVFEHLYFVINFSSTQLQFKGKHCPFNQLH